MTRPRVYKTEGIVIKIINLGEADRLVTLYTPNQGKIRAVAKGARRLKSKLGGHLDLLTQSALLLAQGQNLDIITQSQTIESFYSLKTDLERISYALYIAELVDQFTVEHVENYPVYKLLQTSLLRFCGNSRYDIILRQFELQLLSHLGYQPELYQCPDCKSALSPGRNMFSANSGGILCPDCALNKPMCKPLSVDAIKVMRFLLTSDQVSAGRLRISHSINREIEQSMSLYIRFLLDREVKSLEFLAHMKKRG